MRFLLKLAFYSITVVSLSAPVCAQQAAPHSREQLVLWQDRGELSKLDMVNGPGGAAHQPGTHFKFLKELMSGTSPKMEVEDENGVRWKVKMGPEVKPETAATRLLWAVGYTVDEDYYRREIVVEGLQHLKRGMKFVHNGNTVVNVRLERHRSGPEPTEWSWYDDSLSASSEFNRLRVMMALINNWDLKDMNNSVYKEPYGEVYVVSDLGATLGRTGNVFFRSKGNAKEFAGTPFIRKVHGQYIDFVIHSRPIALGYIFNHPHYVFRTRMESIVRNIPLEDARWLGNYLGRLSMNQIEDCFRASGFSAAEVDIYSRTLTRRIMELKNL